MSYLILDTDKHTTHSLRLQLSGISTVPIWDALDIPALNNYLKKYRVPAEIIFLDLDGDRGKVKAFEEHLMLSRSPSSALILMGSASRPGSLLKADRYLQKPIFIKNLKQALIEAQAKSQELRSSVIFYGDRLPVDLTREVGRSETLWRQILEVSSLPDFVQDRKDLAQIGALFLRPERVTEQDFLALVQLKKITSASRISLVCFSTQAAEIGKLRTVCDYFVSPNLDWRQFLDQLAQTRVMRLASSLGIDQAKTLLKEGKTKQAKKILTGVIEFAPLKIEAILLAAECDFISGNFDEARTRYQSALSLNPCLPKPYARLLQIEKGSALVAILKTAMEYCPGVNEFQGNSQANFKEKQQ